MRPVFNKAFYKILNAIGDIFDWNLAVFYFANNFL